MVSTTKRPRKNKENKQADNNVNYNTKRKPTKPSKSKK